MFEIRPLEKIDAGEDSEKHSCYAVSSTGTAQIVMNFPKHTGYWHDEHVNFALADGRVDSATIKDSTAPITTKRDARSAPVTTA